MANKTILWLLLSFAGQALAAVDTPVNHCGPGNPLREAWFGDLHVHTALSLDASMQDTRTRPADAYRYARGEAIDIPPYSDDGVALNQAQIGRPLDFAAVTDHAEMLGENRICHTPGMQGYWSPYCMGLRWMPRVAGLLFAHTASNARRLGFCGEHGEVCLQASRGPWEETIAAAEAADNADGDCRFTSFIGYEWTGAAFPRTGMTANLHRNVIFRNGEVPALPISFVESSNAPALYRQLDESCVGQGKGCDALVIPHNSNLSLGMMFQQSTPGGDAIGVEDAQLRARYETLAEIIQHKGASECYFDAQSVLAQDELCNFEQLPWNSFSGNTFDSMREPIQPDAGLLREVLQRGLQLEQSLGANPFKFGFIGSTDTHRALAGGVEEYDFPGHGGAGNAAVKEDAAGLPDQWEFNPGGLAVLYAEQNTRESLFQAMRRREAYATSGPRIKVRLFAGAGIPPDLCEQADFVAQGYRHGVPMGGDLTRASSAPRFAVSALKDAGVATHAGTDLQQVQIIKGWVDERGESQERVYTVAGDADNNASVDLRSCAPIGEGFSSLCRVWEDPDFNATQRAFYYARVVENPTCRWSTRVCNAQRVDCSKPDSLSKETRICCASEVPKTVQERAWTSPIWYTP